jgi:hypothetical protein
MKETTLSKITASVRVAKGMAERVLAASPNPQWTEYELQTIDEWIARQGVKLDRSEAIRRLVELGLKAKTEAKPVRKPGRRLRAQELATQAIEKIIDPAAPPDERTQRRRLLIKGPLEFREDRVDRPKAKK